MRIPRVYVDRPLVEGEVLTLDAEASSHLLRVLRLRSGASLILFNGAGGEFEARLSEIRDSAAVVITGAFQDVSRESRLDLRLAQGISRGPRMDLSIQKAVELGVSHIYPVITKHSVVRLDTDRAERRLNHWRGMVRNASEQCRRTRLPKVSPATALNDWFRQVEQGGLKLVLAPGGAHALGGMAHDGEPITLLVGPEGGLSDAELALAELAGFRPVTLGPRILRTETATVAGLTAVQAVFGDLLDPV
jgi:16S rRNA (uracil1498-N3)-methyltransferase